MSAPIDGHAHEPTSTPAAPELSRRALIGGITAAGALGLAAGAALPGGIVHAAPGDQTEALDPTVAGLVYLPLDAFAFDTAQAAQTPYRLYQDITGMQPSNSSGSIYAALPIPVGAVIRKLDISFQGQPEITVMRRAMDGTLTPLHGMFAPLAAGGGVKTQTYTLDATITHGATYFVQAACSAGDSVLGMMVGYVPAPQAFIPFTGNNPRALDTREGGLTRFAANEERVVNLSSLLIPTARAAVINLTAVDVSGGGFLSAYADGIPWPGNSTVNYASAGQTVANAAVVTMANGRIKVRAGVNGAHVVLDVVGSLL